jgi:transcriptional regulator with XRE-family HTH domain
MIGERLKLLRKKKQLSQKELAAILGTSQGYVCDIELNKKQPGSDFLISLKRFIDVDLNWFLMGDEVRAVADQGPVYLSEIGPAEKKKLKLEKLLGRIIAEGDDKKIKVVEGQLELLDPGEKKQDGANEQNEDTGVEHSRMEVIKRG